MVSIILYFMERHDYTLRKRKRNQPQLNSRDQSQLRYQAVILGAGIVPIILRAGGKELPLYAVLDPGSQISVITRRTVRSFNLRGPVKRVIINTVDGESNPTDREIVNFEITSKDGRSSFEIVDAHVRDSFNIQQRPIDLDALVKRWPHLAHVPIDSTKQEDVILLVGQDHPAAVEVFETKMDPYDQRAPRAYLTAFGWC
jgi:hypothetical protein